MSYQADPADSCLGLDSSFPDFHINTGLEGSCPTLGRSICPPSRLNLFCKQTS